MIIYVNDFYANVDVDVNLIVISGCLIVIVYFMVK